MFSPGDLVRCRFLSGIYTPLGIIIREAKPSVYEVFVMHLPDQTVSVLMLLAWRS